MDFRDRDKITVNSPDGYRNNRDNGQNKYGNKSSALPQQMNSRTGSGNRVMIPPDMHSAASSSHGKSSSFQNKENMPSNETSGAILSTSSKENLCAMLKSAMETVDSDNGFQEQPVYAASDLHHQKRISSGIEESTEVIGYSSSYMENHFGEVRTSPGTDSDIEILSKQVVAAPNPWQNCYTGREKYQRKSKESKPKKNDQEIIVVDYTGRQLSGLDIPELLKNINEQKIKIKELENTLDRFRERHKTLFEHVEALRLALDMKDIDTIKSGGNPIDKL